MHLNFLASKLYTCPVMYRVLQFSVEGRVIWGITNCVSHVKTFTLGLDAIFKKYCKFYTSVQDVNLNQDAVKAAF